MAVESPPIQLYEMSSAQSEALMSQTLSLREEEVHESSDQASTASRASRRSSYSNLHHSLEPPSVIFEHTPQHPEAHAEQTTLLPNDKIQPSSSVDREACPRPSQERPAGQYHQVTHAIDDHAGQITLLPCEDREPALSGNTHSPSNHLDKSSQPLVAPLHRSGYIILMVSIYAILALTAWSLTCVLTFKPLTTTTYGFDTRTTDSTRFLLAKFADNENWYRAARALQTLAAVLTIPICSAVCSAAAVVFAQSNKRERRLTMRQTITLADKGWTDPSTIAKLLLGRGKKLSSSLLICALFLNLFGVSITTLQTILLSQKSIKVPTGNESYTADSYAFGGIVDIPDKFDVYGSSPLPSLGIMLLRNALKSTTNTHPQPRLWQDGVGCSSANKSGTEQCLQGISTLGNLSALTYPYLAQLPVGFHTGLIRQFIPRINSTISWEFPSAEELPANCNELPGAFYAHYAHETIDGGPRNWSIEACMPDDQSVSPWKNTYSRQDFTEELYLNISVMGYGDAGLPLETPSTGGLFRITSRTTAGYFELPNYMNGGLASSIIDGEPDHSDNCGHDCKPQRHSNSASIPRAVPPVTDLRSNGSWSLSMMDNRGPLLTVAIALFGYESYISAQLNHVGDSMTDYEKWYNQSSGPRLQWGVLPCVDQIPLVSLLQGPGANSNINCITETIPDPRWVDSELASYAQSFYASGTLWNNGGLTWERLTNAFASAVFLATENWLTLDTRGNLFGRSVHSDAGADAVIPAISRMGMILISLLWAIFLTCLFGLALYSARTPRWTNQLDAFAMMRIGAATNEQISLGVGFEAKTIVALDELPGFIGDATEGDGAAGALGVGARTPLNGTRRYKCYKGDALKAFQNDQSKLPWNERQSGLVEVQINGKIYKVRNTKQS